MNGVCIIAEAGVNHNGSVELARKMVDVAKDAGADYIKFQTFKPDNLVSKYAKKADYQKQTTDANESQLDMLKKLTLMQKDYIELKKYCEKREIGFISTPFDIDSIHFLDTLDMDFWKLPSGEITNLPYLRVIGKTGRPVVLSTGMSNISEIKAAISVLKKAGATSIKILHCNTEYPTPMEDVNLLAMNEMRNSLKCEVGYSDHTPGIEVPIAAVALGATIIEKHFTLDKSMEGPDHKASLEPDELKQMISCIRNIEYALGDGKKRASKSEMKNITIARKSIIATTSIRKGEVFTEANLTTKRPGSGVSPMKWDEVIGTKATRDYQEDEMVEL